MYSFYGGRPGNSFVIVTTYESVNDMITEFKKGPDYTAVHYNEHVLINTPNKNHEDNGKIFRRGYDYKNDLGGAEYIGTIVGPSGPAPNLKIGTLDWVEDQSHPTDGSLQTEDTGIQQWTVGNKGLVPGKTNDGYNDNIRWRSFVVRTSNNQESTAYIGFEIPYPIIEFETKSIKPYDSNGQYLIDASSTERVDDKTHPFYEKWSINIPKGLKGDSFKNLKIITANNEDGVEAYEGRTDDRNNGREILVYDQYNYDSYEQGELKRYYLGDYNVIKDVSLDDDGTLIISYTHDDQIEKIIKWIKEINLQDDGTLQVTYNNKKEDGKNDVATFPNALKSIDNIDLNNDGTLIITYNDSTSDIFNQAIRWINEISLTPSGSLNVSYNNGPTATITENNLKWITDLYLQTDGTILAKYNDSDKPEPLRNQDLQNVALKWITNLLLNQNGTLTINYNNGTSETLNANTPIKWIKDISQENGDLKISYNTVKENQESSQLQQQTTILSQALNIPTNIYLDYSDYNIKAQWKKDNEITTVTDYPINYISNVAIDGAGNLLMRFTDPTRRGQTSYNGYNDWSYIGTVSPGAFGFNGDNVNIVNKNFLGYLNYNELLFNLSTSQFLSNQISEIQIESCDIDYYSIQDNTLIGNITSPLTDPYTITFDAFGINFDFKNVTPIDGTTSTDSTPVNILIKNLQLSFSFNDSSEVATIDWQERLNTLERRTDSHQSLINTCNNNIRQAQISIGDIFQRLGNAEININEIITNDRPRIGYCV